MTLLCLVSGFYFSLYKIYIIKTLLSISRWQLTVKTDGDIYYDGAEDSWQLRVFIP